MKKLLSVLLSFCMLFSGFSVGVFAASDKVEISFCVGDSTLTINGEAVTVETPYVVGEGVTLVPVRVITESFGARVDWDGDTKTVYLDYAGTNIVLQIGNPIAKINGVEKELLAAPELSANGFTMVPIRFISENFGAEVGYDPNTRRVMVTGDKKSDADSVWTIDKSTNLCSSESFGISLILPDGFSLSKGDSNEIVVESDSSDESLIKIDIYSKESVTGSSALGRKIIAENKSNYNMSAVVSDSAVSTATYKNFSGHEYGGEVKSYSPSGTFKNVFFENGEFVYSVAVFKDSSLRDDFTDMVLNSIELNTPMVSASEFARTEKTSTPFTVTTIPSCEFTIPGEFTETENELLKIDFKDELRSDRKLVYSDGDITFEARRVSIDFSDVKVNGYQGNGVLTFNDVKYIFTRKFQLDSNTEMEGSGTTVKYGDNKFFKIRLYEEGYDYVNYHDLYVTESNDVLYMFYISYPEVHYSTANRDVMTKIMQSVKILNKKK